jgi:hypothetical protein
MNERWIYPAQANAHVWKRTPACSRPRGWSSILHTIVTQASQACRMTLILFLLLTLRRQDLLHEPIAVRASSVGSDARRIQ